MVLLLKHCHAHLFTGLRRQMKVENSQEKCLYHNICTFLFFHYETIVGEINK